MLRRLRRLVTLAASLVLGVAVALFVVALHDYWWGLLLGLATTAACLVALPPLWARLPFGVGWAVFTVLAAQTRPEGDFVISRDPAGWVLLASAVVVLICSMIGARDHRPSVAPPGPEGPDSR